MAVEQLRRKVIVVFSPRFSIVLLVLSACSSSAPPPSTGQTAGGSPIAINAGAAAVAGTGTAGAPASTAAGRGAATGGTRGGGQSGATQAQGGSGTAASAGTSAAAAGATAGASAASGSGAAGAAGSGGAPVAGMPDPSAAGAPAGNGPATGTFPPITDPWKTGPFSVAMLGRAGPSNNATVLYPRDLGKDGLKHPIVVWDNGAGQTGLSIYGGLLNHLASHGFAVYAAYSATDGGKELKDGLDWMIAQAMESGSPFYQKLDPSKTAAMGHSQGSIATFAIAGDPRLTTTLHLSGGTNPDIAEGHATLPNLHRPSAFLCGDTGGDGLVSGDAASEWCAYDFEHTDVPVFLVQVKGASHISAPGMMNGACAAWLRWHLTGDMTMRMQFAGDDCVLCKRPNWMTKSKGL